MRPDEKVAVNGRLPVTAAPVGAGAELDGLRATCRRQAHVIDALGEALSTLRSRAAALNAENAELRAAHERVASRAAARARATSRTAVSSGVDARAAVDVSLALDVRAPRAARMAVAECLRGRVTEPVLESARLIVSELVSNSVCHSGASGAGVAVVRVRRTRGAVWLEVQDPGRGGVITPRRPDPDPDPDGGFGLHVVQALSERWGLERVAAGGTRVWAQLPRAALIASQSADAPGEMSGARPAANGKPGNGHAATRRQQRAGAAR